MREPFAVVSVKLHSGSISYRVNWRSELTVLFSGAGILLSLPLNLSPLTPLHLQPSRRLPSKAPARMSSSNGVQHVLVLHVLGDHWKRVATFMLPWMATSITDVSVLWVTARHSITHNISFQRPKWMPSGDASSVPTDVPQSSLNPQYLMRPSINVKLHTRLQMAISKRQLWTILMILE